MNFLIRINIAPHDLLPPYYMFLFQSKIKIL